MLAIDRTDPFDVRGGPTRGPGQGQPRRPAVRRPLDAGARKEPVRRVEHRETNVRDAGSVGDDRPRATAVRRALDPGLTRAVGPIRHDGHDAGDRVEKLRRLREVAIAVGLGDPRDSGELDVTPGPAPVAADREERLPEQAARLLRPARPYRRSIAGGE